VKSPIADLTISLRALRADGRASVETATGRAALGEAVPAAGVNRFLTAADYQWLACVCGGGRARRPPCRVVAMQQEPSEAGEVFQRLAGVIWQAAAFLWNWSFGQVVNMFQLPFNSLPVWKQVLFVLVIASLVYLVHKVSKDLLKAVQSVVGAVVGLVAALIQMLPQIMWAGLIAFGGAWVILNLNPAWIPNGMQ
jgi:hypothetical protein